MKTSSRGWVASRGWIVASKGWIVAILVLLCIPFVSAVPTIGAATGVSSSNATFQITGSTGSTFVWYGQYSGHPVWKSENVTPVITPFTITIWGAPILGGTTYYATACDSTGCGNTVSFTTLAITPIPTRNYDAGFNEMQETHFSPVFMGRVLVEGYTTNMPATVMFGIILGSVIVAFWRTTKSVRLVSIVFMCLSPLVLSKQAGLYIGMPSVMQSLGAVMFAAGIAGVLLSFVKKT